MKTLKTVTIFVAGMVTYAYISAWMAKYNTDYPREGAVVYEDEKIKVTRLNTENNKGLKLATVLYKEQPVEE